MNTGPGPYAPPPDVIAIAKRIARDNGADRQNSAYDFIGRWPSKASFSLTYRQCGWILCRWECGLPHWFASILSKGGAHE